MPPGGPGLAQVAVMLCGITWVSLGLFSPSATLTPKELGWLCSVPSCSQATGRFVTPLLFCVIATNFSPTILLESPWAPMPSWLACHFRPGAFSSPCERGTPGFTHPRDPLSRDFSEQMPSRADRALARRGLARSSHLRFPCLRFPFHLFRGSLQLIIPFTVFQGRQQ